jgi:hypothetical protein
VLAVAHLHHAETSPACGGVRTAGDRPGRRVRRAAGARRLLGSCTSSSMVLGSTASDFTAASSSAYEVSSSSSRGLPRAMRAEAAQRRRGSGAEHGREIDAGPPVVAVAGSRAPRGHAGAGAPSGASARSASSAACSAVSTPTPRSAVVTGNARGGRRDPWRPDSQPQYLPPRRLSCHLDLEIALLILRALGHRHLRTVGDRTPPRVPHPCAPGAAGGTRRQGPPCQDGGGSAGSGKRLARYRRHVFARTPHIEIDCRTVFLRWLCQWPVSMVCPGGSNH